MRWTQTLIPTLREDPQDAEIISHKLLIRGGFIRKLIAGMYSYLPLGVRVLSKVQDIIREEMTREGAEEVLLPALQPIELWTKTGRDKDLADVMIKFKDRHGRMLCLGPTHEEVITSLVGNNISSYKDLPRILFQLQTKFRDEIRPRFGVIRSCEFIMKDAYSFDADEKGLEKNYKKMYDAYCRIFQRCGLPYKILKADPGFMGGGQSHEFMVAPKGGEDIEIGHTFKLGTKYSETLGARFLDKNGKTRPVVMGCYGIGVNRIPAAVIETSHDTDGIIWPKSISPYEIAILPLNVGNEDLRKFGENLYTEMAKAGLDVIIDDRPERAGVKFKDADLIGFPIQVIIGEKNLQKGKIEIKTRKDKKSELVDKKSIIKKLKI
ncbi:MAG: proline--tRNA ligase [Candidatus Omnitrophota bacterium]|nr:MAG: proline--tRNA ligase [Candidatus Omnitrophota bacterium]